MTSSKCFFAIATLLVLFGCGSPRQPIAGTVQAMDSLAVFSRQAYEVIAEEISFNDNHCLSAKPSVSEEVLNFGLFAPYNLDHIVDRIDTSKVVELSLRPPVVATNPMLSTIGQGRWKCGKVFFSEIEAGYFFAEYFMENLPSYQSRPSFGASQFFLFEVVNSRQVVLIKSAQLQYN
ncbi:hypothetical protein GGR26_001991 [Lewinella marina]|uniref:hypothetical protein n=1 Tax=Neolewinella marina TaxID=438751 RepID=UPI00117A54EA|nr:hypothetical protein [Neolewinella marina]NJB86223.1 hypothetical protein [Neolewinella marina]